MTPEQVERAAEVLEGEALLLRAMHMLRGEWCDPSYEADYAEWLSLAKALRKMLARYRAASVR